MKMTHNSWKNVIDVCANIGYISAIASGLVGNTGQVHAFEPIPQNVSRLRQNLSAFRWARLYPCAVGEAPGKATIYFNESEAGWASLLISDDLKCRADVDVIRLDDWARDHAINRVDFVKMDIEGGEFHALRGAQEMLSRFRPIIFA